MGSLDSASGLGSYRRLCHCGVPRQAVEPRRAIQAHGGRGQRAGAAIAATCMAPISGGQGDGSREIGLLTLCVYALLLICFVYALLPDLELEELNLFLSQGVSGGGVGGTAKPTLQIIGWVTEKHETICSVVLDMSNVVNIDTSGLVALEEVHKELAFLGIQMAIASPGWQAIHKMKLARLVDKVGEEWIFLTVGEAVEACLASKTDSGPEC